MTGEDLAPGWMIGLLVALAAPSRGADTLVLPASECKAWFRLYRDTAMETEVGSPLGGVVYPVLYLRIGSGWAIDASTEALRLEITDNYGNYEAGTEVTKTYADIGVSQGAWQRKPESQTWWTADAPPGHAVNQTIGPIYFRYCFPPWNSMTEPLGNNGQHTLLLTAPVAFLSPTQQVITNVGPEAKAVTTENVYITDVQCSNGTIDYVKWDPAGDSELQDPTIAFAVRDADPHQYTWTIWFRRTHQTEAWTGECWSVSGQLDPGQSTASVSLRPALEAAQLMLPEHDLLWGTFTYDIQVTEYCGPAVPADSFTLKWPYSLYVPTNAPDGDGDENDGHTLELDESATYRVRYWLEGAPSAAVGTSVVVLDDLLREREHVTVPAETRVMHEGLDEDNDQVPDGIPVHTRAADDTEGTWRFLWIAQNASATRDRRRRTHDSTRMLVANADHRRKHRGLVVRGKDISGSPEAVYHYIKPLFGLTDVRYIGEVVEQVEGFPAVVPITPDPSAFGVLNIWWGAVLGGELQLINSDKVPSVVHWESHGFESGLWLKYDEPSFVLAVGNEAAARKKMPPPPVIPNHPNCGVVFPAHFPDLTYKTDLVHLLACRATAKGLPGVLIKRGVRVVIGYTEAINDDKGQTSFWNAILYKNLGRTSKPVYQLVNDACAEAVQYYTNHGMAGEWLELNVSTVNAQGPGAKGPLAIR